MNDPNDPNEAIEELYWSIRKNRYPSLAWMVRWEDRMQQLWREASDDAYMRYLVVMIDKKVERLDVVCDPYCNKDMCMECVGLCRKTMPTLPSVEELLDMRRSQP